MDEDGERLVAAIKRDYRQAELSPADRAMLDYAVRLTREPSALTEAAVDELRHHGFDDAAVHDIVQVTALFNYYNRLADGLGIDLEPEMPPPPARDERG